VQINKVIVKPSLIQLSESQEQLLLKSALKKAGVENMIETRKSVDFTEKRAAATIESAETATRKQTFTPKSIEKPQIIERI